MRRGRIVRRVGTLLTAVGVAGSLLAGPASATGATAQLSWGACPADVPAQGQPLECATLAVPLDYREPDGPKIDVMISRLASQNPAKRRGILLTNPGGPGGAGLSLPADLVTLGLPTTVSDTYDVIGMDPRGVGHSSPVSCGFTAEDEYGANIPPYAVDAAAVAKQAEIAKRVAARCAANDPDGRLPFMTTANAARDMDRIRVALGEEKLSFFGASYGSVLGAAYASLFAERSDRIVLDSNVGGTALDHEGLRRFGLGAEQRFPDFAKYLAARHATYGLGRTPAAVRRNYLTLAERLDREPVAGIDGNTFRLGVFVTLYGDAGFPGTARLWQSLAASNGAEAHRQLDELELAPSPYDNAFSSFLAVTCGDADFPADVATYQRDVAQDRRRYPLFGAAGANVTPCAYWHHEPVEPPVRITDDGPRNVLVVQNLRDPATPHVGGVINRKAFGDRARLVSIDQGGHGAYIFNDNPCGLNVTTTFLVEGKLPAFDKFCPASTASGPRLDSAGEQRRAEVLRRLRVP